ncbi:MAG: AAA family ATPase [Anaerolineales bacterium]|jgi:hypothetical protein
MVNNESREINTGGGAFAEGGVETGGGDFVGRDQYKQSISAQGYGSIQNVTQISGEVVYNLYSGADVFKKHIRTREFQTLVAERTKTFIGRDFIFSAINALLDDPEFPSGYIVIIGEPGIGKTSLLAQLVQTTGLVHHFNIASQNIRSLRDFLVNVCSQLIVRYELDHPHLPEEASKDSGFLSQLLAEAAEKEHKQSRKVVILVDALDEAEDLALPPTANRLYLPPALPEGVYFILTTREKAQYRLLVDRIKNIYLRDDDPNNLKDVRGYIRRFLVQHPSEMAARLEEWSVDEEEFVDILTSQSQGNFMYLVHVLRDIKEGLLTRANVDNIRKLPQGLREYYQRHWRMMKAQDTARFERLQQPVVCILATVREPVAIDNIAEWTGLGPYEVRQVIDEWQEFLDASEREDGETLYRIYHASFQDFLREEVGLKQYHGMIADSAKKKIRW